jgi:putative ABC transport system substrate-binding protein
MGAILRSHIAKSASYVDRILRGDKPADLPVQQFTKVELILTSRLPRRLGSRCHSRCSAAPTR